MPRLRALAFTSIFFLVACGSSSNSSGGHTAGHPDGGHADSGKTDSSLPDAGKSDGALPDAGKTDSALPDAGKTDGALPDSGGTDGALPDAGKTDGALPDSGGTDGALPDSGGTDGALPDSGAYTGVCSKVPPANRCSVVSNSCSGNVSTQCYKDLDGCLQKVVQDCSLMQTQCDPKTGVCGNQVIPCDPQHPCYPGSSCIGNTLHVCAKTSAGCYADTATDCTATSQICHASSGTAACVDPCSVVKICPATDYCDGIQAVHCAPDSNGCLVASSSSSCSSSQFCSSATGKCVADTLCPAADPTLLDCSTGTISSTTVGGSTILGPYSPSCFNGPGGGTDPAPERIFRFRNNGSTAQGVVIEADSSSPTAVIRALSTGGDTLGCDGSAPCVAEGSFFMAGPAVSFKADPGQDFYVVVDNSSATDTGDPFKLTVNCAAVGCGDGVLESGETCDSGPGYDCTSSCQIPSGSACSGPPSVCMSGCGDGTVGGFEQCDDGNLKSGDGCSSTCQIEPGYACYGTVPSTCVKAAANANCPTATVVDTYPTTETGDLATGHRLVTNDLSCDYHGMIPVKGQAAWYKVTVPAGKSVAVTSSAHFPSNPAYPYLVAFSSCDAPTCLGVQQNSTLVLHNNTGSTDLTEIVALVDNAFASEPFTLDFQEATCGNGVVEAGETCDDGNTTSGDGCSSTCQTESGYICSGAPSKCHIACGDGIIESQAPLYESCDDGNTLSGDGCSSTCQLEANSACTTGSPQTCIRGAVSPVTTSCMDMTGANFSVGFPLLALPFPFTYQGQAMTNYSVDLNGYLQLYPNSSATYLKDDQYNGYLPSTTAPQAMIAPFWEALYYQSNFSSDVATKLFGTAPSRTLVVAWDRWGTKAETSDQLTFQAWLHENGDIEFHYCSMNGPTNIATGSHATIGITNVSGSDARLIAYLDGTAAKSGTGYLIKR